MARQRKPALIDKSRGLIDPAELDRLIAACEETCRFCDDCTAGGLDVGPEAKKSADQLDVARKMRRAFFPGRDRPSGV